jgi:hypothetical protein
LSPQLLAARHFAPRHRLLCEAQTVTDNQTDSPLSLYLRASHFWADVRDLRVALSARILGPAFRASPPLTTCLAGCLIELSKIIAAGICRRPTSPPTAMTTRHAGERRDRRASPPPFAFAHQVLRSLFGSHVHYDLDYTRRSWQTGECSPDFDPRSCLKRLVLLDLQQLSRKSCLPTPFSRRSLGVAVFPAKSLDSAKIQ